jgi:ABC-type antimicrobial peptide transport system permease subunit
MLLFGHLSIATRLRGRRRIALAIVVVLPLAGLIALDESRYDADFDTAIHFPSQLKPVPPSWVPTRTVAKFFAGTDALEDAVDALIEDGEDG